MLDGLDLGAAFGEHRLPLTLQGVLVRRRDVRRAVESLFEVKVSDVRTINYLGKRHTRFGRLVGTKAAWKKAYVTLADPTQTVELLEKI